MPDVTLRVTGAPGELPRWAVLECDPIDRTDEAVGPVIDRYVREDGSVMWPPGDDYLGIDAPILTVRLEPGARASVAAGLDRYSRDPAYEPPWRR